MAREVTAHHESLRASEHNVSTPSYDWEIAALDEEGYEVFRTEYRDSRKEAVKAAAEANAQDVCEMPEHVVAYEPVETRD
jgi:hypothetical protein